MLRYLGWRLIAAVLVVVLVTTASFIGLHLAGGDPVLLLVPAGASPEIIENTRRVLGFDQPLGVQYFTFLTQAMTGNFPNSLVTNQPALEAVFGRLPATLDLALAATAVGVVTGLALGFLSVVPKSNFVRSITTATVSLLQATPTFFLAILSVLLFAVHLRLLPTGGSGSPAHLVLPAVMLGISSIAPSIARIFRGSLVEVRSEDFIFALTARGIARPRILGRHVLPNSSLPLITVLGMEFGALLGGTVIIEQIFSWPGVGRLILDSIFLKDFPVVLAGVVFLSASLALINIIIDVLYTVIDPRVRLTGGGAA